MTNEMPTAENFILVVKGKRWEAVTKANEYGFSPLVLKAGESDTILLITSFNPDKTLETLTTWFSSDSGEERKPGSLLFYNQAAKTL